MRRMFLAWPLAIVVLASFGSGLSAQTIGYWRFEEGADGVAATTAGSILDSSTALNPGNPNGGPLYNADVPVTPIPGNGLANTLSLSFDGANDFVLVPTDTALNSPTDFTVEFWMRSNGSVVGQHLLVDKSHGFIDTTGWFFQSSPGTGNIGFGLGNGTAFPGVASTADLFDDQWHHLAGTYDGSEVELWVDGVSQGTETAGTYVANTRDIRFGNAANNGRFFDGNLDEVRISDRVLSSSEFLRVTSVPEPSSFVFGLIAMTLLTLRQRK